jgi:Zeta toxin
MPSSSSKTDSVSTIAPAAQLGVAIAALVFLNAVKRAKKSAAAPANEVVGAYESTLSQLCHVALPHVAPKHRDPGTCAHYRFHWLSYHNMFSCEVVQRRADWRCWYSTHTPDYNPAAVGAAAAEPVVSTIAEKLESGREPVIVGIAGGSGSGKTTLARAVYDSLGADNVTYICHDQVRTCTHYRSMSTAT